jgi:hypothetical protein
MNANWLSFLFFIGKDRGRCRKDHGATAAIVANGTSTGVEWRGIPAEIEIDADQASKLP